MKKRSKRVKTSVELEPETSALAEKLARSKRVHLRYPGMVRPTKKKILELAVSVGLEAIAEKAAL